MLRAESQFANRVVCKGGLLSFPRTGCALLRFNERSTRAVASKSNHRERRSSLLTALHCINAPATPSRSYLHPINSEDETCGSPVPPSNGNNRLGSGHLVVEIPAPIGAIMVTCLWCHRQCVHNFPLPAILPRKESQRERLQQSSKSFGHSELDTVGPPQSCFVAAGH
jgi:hypothetical protein